MQAEDAICFVKKETNESQSITSEIKQWLKYEEKKKEMTIGWTKGAAPVRHYKAYRYYGQEDLVRFKKTAATEHVYVTEFATRQKFSCYQSSRVSGEFWDI